MSPALGVDRFKVADGQHAEIDAGRDGWFSASSIERFAQLFGEQIVAFGGEQAIEFAPEENAGRRAPARRRDLGSLSKVPVVVPCRVCQWPSLVSFLKANLKTR